MRGELSTVKADGRTTCCNAFTSISMEDGVEYCKACYQEVANPGPRFELDLALATCGGCGAYGPLGRTHVRAGEECGTYA